MRRETNLTRISQALQLITQCSRLATLSDFLIWQPTTDLPSPTNALCCLMSSPSAKQQTIVKQYAIYKFVAQSPLLPRVLIPVPTYGLKRLILNGKDLTLTSLISCCRRKNRQLKIKKKSIYFQRVAQLNTVYSS